MSEIITRLAPFVITGILFTAAALLWARHKQREARARTDRDVPLGGGDR